MKKMIAAIILSIFFITGCDSMALTGAQKAAILPVIKLGDNGAGGTGQGFTASDLRTNIDLKLMPNEAGKIMVLMYHNIGKEESEWVRTPANFRKDLNTLYEEGYRPISLKDYVMGNIYTEQGYTPIVITFDDGNMNNFEYLENGQIKEDSAVGILMRFHEEHQDFPLEATFYITGSRPFQQNGLESKKLRVIIDNGMDIGNHTQDHLNLTNAAGDEIQNQIGSQAQYLKRIIGRDDYKINTLALPYGSRPTDKTLTKFLSVGSTQGVPYENIAVLNVGWNPGYSPYDRNFDPASIPRIRASEMKVDNVGLYDYLAYFDRNPAEKFISDGVVGIITVPAGKKEGLNLGLGKETYVY